MCVFKTRLLVCCALLSLIFSGMIEPFIKSCFLPGQAAKCSSEESCGAITVANAEDLEVSFRLLEWLDELFDW